MKKLISTYAAMAMIASASAFESEFRNFTALNGQTIRARITDFDATQGRIQFEREDGNQAWIKANVFSADDRIFILGWMDSCELMADEALSIEVTPKPGHGRTRITADNLRIRKTPSHDIVTLTKTGQGDLTEVRIDYRYFVYDPYASESEAVQQLAGEITVGSVTNSEPVEVKTAPIDLITEYQMSEEFDVFGKSHNEVTLRDDELIGVWFKISGAGPGGVSVVRDFCYPSNLVDKVKWEAVPTVAPAQESTQQSQPDVVATTTTNTI